MFRRFKILSSAVAALLLGSMFGCGCGMFDCLIPNIPKINICDLSPASLISSPCDSLSAPAAIVTAILNEELAG